MNQNSSDKNCVDILDLMTNTWCDGYMCAAPAQHLKCDCANAVQWQKLIYNNCANNLQFLDYAKCHCIYCKNTTCHALLAHRAHCIECPSFTRLD